MNNLLTVNNGIDKNKAIAKNKALAMNPLLRKLANFTALSEEESRAVDDCCKDVREVGAREDVITQGDRTGGVKLLLDGFACRYKTLEDGRRQIVAYFVPGDLCDLRVFIL
jgi:CRP-like cAMP-binding protein